MLFGPIKSIQNLAGLCEPKLRFMVGDKKAKKERNMDNLSLDQGYPYRFGVGRGGGLEGGQLIT